MTKSVGVHEAKTHLSRLLDDVMAGDPFDRLLVAQAQRLDLTIVTADRAVAQYDVDSILV